MESKFGGASTVAHVFSLASKLLFDPRSSVSKAEPAQIPVWFITVLRNSDIYEVSVIVTRLLNTKL
jgi:hypothetical protein